MSPKGKVQKQKQSKGSETKQAARQEQGIDYGKLRDAIVEANKIVKENEEADQQKSMESDHLTKLLVELLNGLFIFAIVLLASLSIGAVVYSVILAQNEGTTTFAIICWIVFALVLAGFGIVDFQRKKGKKKKAWIKAVAFVALLLMVGLLIATAIKGIALLVSMLLTAFFIIGLAFCRLAMKAVSYEKDRAYLVAYFSAITGIAALVVSVVALVVSSK